MANKHYIFAYGSLINSASRRLTGFAGDSIPVMVRGLQRYWVGFAGMNMRPVGVRPVVHDGQTSLHNQYSQHSQHSYCNGVLFAVSTEALEQFDRRETGYVRQLLAPAQIEYLQSHAVPLDSTQPVWVYIYPYDPNQYQLGPISQAYLDVILLGCLEVGEDFARAFLQHTYLWQDWHNDRLQPRYPRAIEHQQAAYIDHLLQQTRKEFECRY